MQDLDRFNRLISRGSEYRVEMLAALYDVWQRVELVGEDAPPAVRQLCHVVAELVRGIARAEELGAYMGKEKTDAYGVVVDAEEGADQIRRWLAWRREIPFRNVRVRLSREEAVRIGVAVDRHRREGHSVTPANLPALLTREVMDRVDEALHEVVDDARDRAEMLGILASALEAQSIDRVLILVESFPGHYRQEG